MKQARSSMRTRQTTEIQRGRVMTEPSVATEPRGLTRSQAAAYARCQSPFGRDEAQSRFALRLPALCRSV